MKSSRIPGFYKMSLEDQVNLVVEFSNLNYEERNSLEKLMNPNRKDSPLLEIAANFLVNSRDYLVPMLTDEPSVVPAATKGAKLARETGGFHATYSGSHMTGQIYFSGVDDLGKAIEKIKEHKDYFLEHANSRSKSKSVKATDMQVKYFPLTVEQDLIINFDIDTGDSMGANKINKMMEYVAPKIQEAVGSGKAIGRILSNYSPKRLATAEVEVSAESLGGEEIVGNIVKLYNWACHDIKRAVTNNKGIMNGVDAVAAATLNDYRAIEASCHVHAIKHGSYQPLSSWTKTDKGNLRGKLELPLQIGTVGDVIDRYHQSRISMKILGVGNVAELACVAVSTGLSSNLTALRALADEGIQRGHMKLHKEKTKQ